jgi:hypothetical protein
VAKTLDDPAHVVPKTDEVPVYGRAYPKRAAYPAEIPIQSIAPLQYTIKAGQEYVVADDSVKTDYRATTFNGAPPHDHVVVSGQDRHYQIWFGHWQFFVRAADIDLVG